MVHEIASYHLLMHILNVKYKFATEKKWFAYDTENKLRKTKDNYLAYQLFNEINFGATDLKVQIVTL